ncbi:MAG: hypothetical protein H6634_15515 [Anaerolineales bacterium]|nr:hypothetical protein [Anaerolineales bacterium]
MAFISNRSDDPDAHPEHDDLFVMPASGGEAKRSKRPLV